MGRKAGTSDRLLSFFLLGPPEIRLGADPLPPLPSRKAWALLVFLAVESSHHHDRKALASLLWPDVSLERSLASLRQSLLALRRTLGDERLSPPFLEAGPRTVGFNPSAPHRLDLNLLEAPPPECRILEDPEACARCADYLRIAAEGIRGPFLEGFGLPGCEEFEAWVEGVREQTRTQAARTIERLVRFNVGEGDLPEAIQFAARGLRIDPFDERGHRRLMRLLLASGDRRAAELQFEACRNLLVRELGVPPEPETLALLKEIREGEGRGVEPPESPDGSPECCPVTVLFFDGLQEAPGRVDTAPLSEGFRRILDRVPDFVSRRGGVFAPSHGGTFISWFGLGHLREGAARRAARTALELADLFRRETGASVRSGLHTGTVVAEGRSVSDSSGSAERIAMSLCMQAEPGDLLLSESTATLLAHQFRLEQVLGLRIPTGAGTVHRLLGLSDPSAPDGEEGSPSLSGRGRELSLFRDRWRSGCGGVMVLEGPPGIGKSRLVRAFVDLARTEPPPDGQEATIRTLACLPQYSDSPFFPLVRLMRDLIGICWNQEESLSRTRIQGYVQALGLPDPRRAQETLEDLFGLSPRPGPRRLRISRRQSVEELILGILRIRGRRPLLLIVEDLHWADESTRQVLKKALEDPGLSRRLLTVLTVREGERPPWVDRLPNLCPIPLPPLTDEESRRMAHDLAGPERLAEPDLSELVRAAGGIPLYLAEGVRNLLEGQHDDLPASQRPHPRTLDELLSDRLARYPGDRPFYQRAAVIGRVIPGVLFRAISPESPMALDRFLSRGIRAGLLRRLEEPAETSFEFCHLLFQEAALRSLVPEERERLHLRVGETLLQSFPAKAEATPELLAHHFERGGRSDLAISWYERAGRRSFARGSLVEALKNTESALRLLRSSPHYQKNPGIDLARLLVLLGKIRTETAGLGAEVEAIFREAEALSGAGKRVSLESVHSLFGHFQVLLAKASLDDGEEILRGLAGGTGPKGSPAVREMVRFATGQLHYLRGEVPEALESLRDPEPEKEWPGSFLPGGFGRQIASFRALGLWMAGKFRQAREERGRIEGWALEKTPLRGFYLMISCLLSRNLGEVGAVLEKSEEILLHAQEEKSGAWIPSGMGFRGWALARAGRSEGLSLLLKSLPLARRIHRVGEPLFLSLLAEAYLAWGDGRRARRTTEAGLEFIRRTGARTQEADLWRLRGESALLMGDPGEAEKDFKRAMEVAQCQRAPGLALQGAVALALFYCDHGSPEKVRPLLLPLEALVLDPGDDFSQPEVRTARDLLERSDPFPGKG